MEFTEVIKNRKSIRTYSPDEVEKEKINAILTSARLAPSWENKQCWHFVVIKEKATIQTLAKTFIINRWLKDAPVLIIACGDPKDSGTLNGIHYFSVDVAIAMEHVILAATDLGLGTCWIGGFNEKKIKKIIGIPDNIRVVALTPLGYPASKARIGEKAVKMVARSSRRKHLDEFVHHEKWGK